MVGWVVGECGATMGDRHFNGHVYAKQAWCAGVPPVVHDKETSHSSSSSSWARARCLMRLRCSTAAGTARRNHVAAARPHGARRLRCRASLISQQHGKQRHGRQGRAAMQASKQASARTGHWGRRRREREGRRCAFVCVSLWGVRRAGPRPRRTRGHARTSNLDASWPSTSLSGTAASSGETSSFLAHSLT